MISIIIPTRNRADVLQRTLTALQAQSDAPSFEVIVVDNGSTDTTPAVLAENAPLLNLQHYTEAVPNRARARNRGLCAAKGELVIFIDDDVLVPAHFVRSHAQAHAAHPNSVVSGPILNVPSADDRSEPRWYNHSRAFFCTCNVSVAAAAIRKVGGFDEGFSAYGWEDTDLGARLRGLGLQRFFAWDAYVRHLKPPGWESLEAAARRMTEKGRMARRFVMKTPTWRIRLATGDHVVNHARGFLLAPPWSLPLAKRVAEMPAIPLFVRAMARGHYLDGLYRAALRGARGSDESHAS